MKKSQKHFNYFNAILFQFQELMNRETTNEVLFLENTSLGGENLSDPVVYFFNNHPPDGVNDIIKRKLDPAEEIAFTKLLAGPVIQKGKINPAIGAYIRGKKEQEILVKRIATGDRLFGYLIVSHPARYTFSRADFMQIDLSSQMIVKCLELYQYVCKKKASSYSADIPLKDNVINILKTKLNEKNQKISQLEESLNAPKEAFFAWSREPVNEIWISIQGVGREGEERVFTQRKRVTEISEIKLIQKLISRNKLKFQLVG
jgi:hypothetical protein